MKTEVRAIGASGNRKEQYVWRTSAGKTSQFSVSKLVSSRAMKSLFRAYAQIVVVAEYFSARL